MKCFSLLLLSCLMAPAFLRGSETVERPENKISTSDEVLKNVQGFISGSLEHMVDSSIKVKGNDIKNEIELDNNKTKNKNSVINCVAKNVIDSIKTLGNMVNNHDQVEFDHQFKMQNQKINDLLQIQKNKAQDFIEIGKAETNKHIILSNNRTENVIKLNNFEMQNNLELKKAETNGKIQVTNNITENFLRVSEKIQDPEILKLFLQCMIGKNN